MQASQHSPLIHSPSLALAAQNLIRAFKNTHPKAFKQLCTEQSWQDWPESPKNLYEHAQEVHPTLQLGQVLAKEHRGFAEFFWISPQYALKSQLWALFQREKGFWKVLRFTHSLGLAKLFAYHYLPYWIQWSTLTPSELPEHWSHKLSDALTHQQYTQLPKLFEPHAALTENLLKVDALASQSKSFGLVRSYALLSVSLSAVHWAFHLKDSNHIEDLWFMLLHKPNGSVLCHGLQSIASWKAFFAPYDSL